MDWGSAPDWVSALANCAVAVAAATAAWQGVRSLTAWRDEAIGRRKAEVAERAIADFLRVRDIYQGARNPLVLAGEFSPEPGEDPEIVKRAAYAPIKRLERQQGFLSEFQAREYELVALFGPEARCPYEKVRSVHNKIVTLCDMIIRSEIDRIGRGDSEYTVQFRKELFATSDDALERALNEAVEAAESICRPAIDGGLRSKTYGT